MKRLASESQYISKFLSPLGVTSSARLVCDAVGTAADFTICTTWFCENLFAELVERNIFEYYDAAGNLAHALSVYLTDAGPQFKWFIGAGKTAVHATPATLDAVSNLERQNIQIYNSFRKDATFALSDYQTVVRSAGGTEWASSLDTVPVHTAIVQPVGITLGNRLNLAGEASVKGNVTVVIRNDTVRSSGTSVTTAAIAAGFTPDGKAPYNQSPAAVVTGANPIVPFNDRISRLRKDRDKR